MDWSHGQVDKFRRTFNQNPEMLTICTPQGERSLTLEDIQEWREKIEWENRGWGYRIVFVLTVNYYKALNRIKAFFGTIISSL